MKTRLFESTDTDCTGAASAATNRTSDQRDDNLLR